MKIDLNIAPFNMRLLNNNRRIVSNLTPVTTIDINTTSGDLHPEGLFSQEIFGRIGERNRNSNFSYIDLGIEVLHPLLFKNVERVAGFYSEIFIGKKYAKWDSKTGSFIESDAVDGETGSSFFLKHFQDIKFTQTESAMRRNRIKLLDNYRSSGLYDFVLVQPAGLRDLEKGKSGNTTQDEINDYYRSLIGLSKTVDRDFKDNPLNDSSRVLMQKAFNAIYTLIFDRLRGKTGRIQSSFSKRRVTNGTRGVITGMRMDCEDLGSPYIPKQDNVEYGLYQAMKGGLPFVQHAFGHSLITDTFNSDGTAEVVDAKTLKLKTVKVSSKVRDKFTTNKGINDLINLYRDQSKRDDPMMVGTDYLALIYIDDKGFKIFKDIDDITVPDKTLVRPVTKTELFYFLTMDSLTRLRTHVTRYPFANENSTSPSIPCIKTTINSTIKQEYDEEWVLKEEVFPNWPIKGEKYVDTIAMAVSTYSSKGADLDGDAVSTDTVYTNESLDEINKSFNDMDLLFEKGNFIMYFSDDISDRGFQAYTRQGVDGGFDQ